MPSKKPLKLTVTVDEESVAKTLVDEAKRRGLPPEELTLEILRDWCEDAFREKDLADHEAGLEDYRQHGGVEANELFRRLRDTHQNRRFAPMEGICR